MLARYIRAGLSRQSFELANGKKVRGYELCSVLPGLELVALPQATPDHLRSPTVLLFRADLKKSEHPEPLMPHLVLQRIALGLKDASEEDRLLFFDAFMEGVAIAHQQLGAFEVQRAVRAAATRPVISPPVVTLEAIAERMPTILEALGTLNIIEKTRLDNPFFQRELCEAVILFLKFSTTLSSQTIAALFALDEQLRFLPPHEKLLAAGQKAEPFIFEGRNVAAFPLREINDWFLVYGSHRARLAHRTRLAKPGEKPENKTLLLDKYYFLRTLLKQNLEMPDAIEKQAETLLQSVSRMIREYTPARKTRPEPAPAAAAAAAAAAAPKPVPTPEPESAPPEFETMPSEPSPG